MIKIIPIIVRIISEIKHLNGAETTPTITRINPINVKSYIIPLPIQILIGYVGIYLCLIKPFPHDILNVIRL